MLKRATFFGTLAGLGFLLGAISGAIATEMPAKHNMEPQPTESTQFRRIEQPLGNKVAVTLGGLGLIGLELWWFLLSKPKSQKVEAREGIQEVTVTVDGGYDPSRIVVQAGQRVRLNFLRKDPSSCLEEVRLPDFHIAQNLPLNEVATIEFTPTKPGRYEFACGMNMFRGVVEAQAPDSTTGFTNDIPPVDIASETAIPSTTATEGEPIMQTTHSNQRIQELNLTVDRGYQPKRLTAEAGLPVRLNIFRKNPSGCLSQLLLPDFNLAVELPLNKTTMVEFTPEQPGSYEFTCGMNMFRGVIEVQVSNASSKGKFSTQIAA